jgi:hypothetical protein
MNDDDFAPVTEAMNMLHRRVRDLQDEVAYRRSGGADIDAQLRELDQVLRAKRGNRR